MNLILLIIGAIIAFIGTIIAFREKSIDRISKGNPVRWTNWSFVLASVGAITTLVSGIKSEQGKAVAERKYDSINSLIIIKEDSIRHINEELKTASDTIRNKTNYIIRLQNGQLDSSKSLLTKSLKTMALLTEQYKEITGYGNRPTVIYWAKKNRDINNNVFNTNEIVIALKNESNYPIHGATIIIHDVNIQQGKFNYLTHDYPSYELAPGATRYFFRQNRSQVDDPPGYGLGVEVFWSRGYYIADIQINSKELNEKGYLKSTIKLHTDTQKPLTKDSFIPHN
ncbi:MAG TPA: hypothetical protein VF939_26730 [Puia sp.]